MNTTRVPSGVPSGGQFATGSKARADVSLDPVEDTDSIASEVASARRVCQDMLGTEHALGTSGYSLGAAIEHVYGDLMWGRDAPSIPEEARVAALAAGSTAVIDARRNATLAAEPYPDSAETGEISYRAMVPIIDSALRGEFVSSPELTTATASEISQRETIGSLMRPDEGEDEDGFCAERPPTRFDVERARRTAESISVPRPMYRSDWERRNGGHGPTVAQVQAEVRDRGSASSERARLAARAGRLQEMYDASNKRQDADAVRCASCGFVYDGFEYFKCPECSSDECGPAV